MSYEDILKLVQEHLQPISSEIAERYKFRQRKQDISESVNTYIAALKKLSKNCNFGTFGLRNDTIRQRLFQKKRLTYSKTCEIALNIEATERKSELISPGRTVQHISKFSKVYKPPKLP